MQSIANKTANMQQAHANNLGLNVVSFNPAIKESKSRLALKLMLEYLAIDAMENTLSKVTALRLWKQKALTAMDESSEINFAEVMQ